MTNTTQKRLILDIERSLHSKVKIMALQSGNTIKDLITSLIIKEIIKRDFKKDIDKHV